MVFIFVRDLVLANTSQLKISRKKAFFGVRRLHNINDLLKSVGGISSGYGYEKVNLIYGGVFGGLALAVYGVIATFQWFPSFGRVYAAYGGIFIVLSVLWS